MPDTTRRTSVPALFAGVALMNTGMAALGATSTLAVAGIVGAAWGGVPNAASIVGTAGGALALGAVMARRGRRAGLLLGYAVAVPGALLAAAGVVAGSVVLVLGGMALLGIGNGGAQLSRYAAAELYPSARKSFAVSLVVWAGTVGALVGPTLIAPATRLAGVVHLTGLAGPFLLMAGVVLLAVLVSVAVHGKRAAGSDVPQGSRGLVRVLARRSPVVALLAMVAAQVDMTAVMTMTPLHMQHEQHGLAAIGGMLSLHIVGMFALSPVNGRLADRFGQLPVIVAGLLVLEAAAALVVLGPALGMGGLAVALFLVGYGWNLCFVGGSGLLTRSLPPAERTRGEAAVDALVWGTSAIASLGSGAVFAGGGYGILVLLAAFVPFAALVAVVWLRPGTAHDERVLHAGPSSCEVPVDHVNVIDG
ncbi:MAG TPA: MFS transporter [Streptosporangiales bacterium]